MLGVTILGNNSAVPAFERHPTAQIVVAQEYQYLVDCGEGTQMQLSRYKVRRSRINRIFISHLHGDHYFGLIGLISSMGLIGRNQPLHVHAPAPLWNILDMQLKVADTQLPFALHFHPHPNNGLIAEDKQTRVYCFPTNHRIECWGFFFEEIKAPRKINRDQAIQNGIPANFFERLQQGEDYTNKQGITIPNHTVTFPGPKGRTYAFCADTKYDENILPYIQNADLIYHETTYLDDLSYIAAARYHSTTRQAARIAHQANAQRLLIGHFSSKYNELDRFETEAREIFPNTYIATEGSTFLFPPKKQE